MCSQITTLWELCTIAIITFVQISVVCHVWIQTCLQISTLCENRAQQICNLYGVSPVVDTDTVSSNYHWCENCSNTWITYVRFVSCVDTDMWLQSTTVQRTVHHSCITFVWLCPVWIRNFMFLQITSLRELCNTGITFVWFISLCGYGHVNSNYNCVSSVHHSCHIGMAYPLCGYGYVSSKYHSQRIVHHVYHICRVCHLCGYGYVSSNYHSARIVHHRYHICMVSHQDGCRHVTSKYHVLRIVHHSYDICVDTDMGLQITTLRELCSTGHHICIVYHSCVDTDMLVKITTLWESCTTEVSHLYGVSHLCGYVDMGLQITMVLRIEHHRNHICKVCLLCGYGHGTSNNYFVTIVHRRYHICMVLHQYVCEHVALIHYCVKNAYHKCHI